MVGVKASGDGREKPGVYQGGSYTPRPGGLRDLERRLIYPKVSLGVLYEDEKPYNGL